MIQPEINEQIIKQIMFLRFPEFFASLSSVDFHPMATALAGELAWRLMTRIQHTDFWEKKRPNLVPLYHARPFHSYASFQLLGPLPRPNANPFTFGIFILKKSWSETWSQDGKTDKERFWGVYIASFSCHLLHPPFSLIFLAQLPPVGHRSVTVEKAMFTYPTDLVHTLSATYPGGWERKG